MREFTAALAIAAALIATDARAEAWSVQDENGQWHNTEHHPDNKPKPQPPKQIPGEKPKDRPTLKADKRDREPPVSTYIGYWCVNPAALPACVDCADPKSGKPRPPRPMTLKPCGPLVHIKGGVIGQW